MPIGTGELIIILIVALIVLGPKRLPEAGRAIGKGLREFKDSVNQADPRPELDAEFRERPSASRTVERSQGDEAP